MKRLLAVLALAAAPAGVRADLPRENLLYWQAFPAGGESDISARHQQFVLKKKCPAIETIIQYKPGVGGAVMWNQMNTLPADGLNIVASTCRISCWRRSKARCNTRPRTSHRRTGSTTPRTRSWFPESSPFKTFQDFVKRRRRSPESSRWEARESTRPTTPRTSASTRSSASRRSTFPTRAPAT